MSTNVVSYKLPGGFKHCLYKVSPRPERETRFLLDKQVFLAKTSVEFLFPESGLGLLGVQTGRVGLGGLCILGHVSQVGLFPAAGAHGHLTPTGKRNAYS
ncbi:hypothetical protein F2P79_004623 [Pimephales promelas]|nr:hypothetical protein F2P79_004623 [Pimephales promelas]